MLSALVRVARAIPHSPAAGAARSSATGVNRSATGGTEVPLIGPIWRRQTRPASVRPYRVTMAFRAWCTPPVTSVRPPTMTLSTAAGPALKT